MMKNIFIILFALPVIAGSFYINQYAGVLQLFLSLSIYGMVLFSIHYLWRNMRKKSIMPFIDFMKNFVLSALIFITVISAIFGFFGYYHNVLHPKTLNQYTLSNGEKTLIFQEMIHIGSENFYDLIVQEITQFKEDGFVYYFEGVKSGSQESNEKFNQAIGIEFNDELYQNMAKTYGLVHQDNQKFLGLVNDQDFNVDTNIDEIIKKYESLKTEKNIEKTYDSPVDLGGETLEMLAKLEGRELEILVFINQALLSAMTKNEEIMMYFQNSFGNDELFQVILDERNKIIAEEIINSQHQKIFATYGALHFKGILKILQENDPNWKIISEKEFIPFE